MTRRKERGRGSGRALALLLSVAAVLLGREARAGTFTLDLNCSSRMRDGRVTVQVTLVNNGDTAMESIRPTVAYAGHPRLEGELMAALAPGARETWALDLAPPPGPPGVYTVVVLARYTDQHGHPFTSLDTVSVFTGDPDLRAPLAGTLAPLTLDGRATTSLTLTATEALTAEVHLALPDEFERLDGNTAVPVTLRPGEPYPLDLAIANRWAVPGSRYRIFAVVNSVRNGAHHSLVVPGRVKVAAPSAPSARAWQLAWWVPAGLLVCFAAAQWRLRTRVIQT